MFVLNIIRIHTPHIARSCTSRQNTLSEVRYFGFICPLYIFFPYTLRLSYIDKAVSRLVGQTKLFGSKIKPFRFVSSSAKPIFPSQLWRHCKLLFLLIWLLLHFFWRISATESPDLEDDVGSCGCDGSIYRPRHPPSAHITYGLV